MRPKTDDQGFITRTNAKPTMKVDLPPARERVCILLCTCNGAKHLEAQLASYLAQEWTAWDLWVSDDGSTDDTSDILARFAQAHGAAHEIRLIDGPRRGVAANFLALLCHPDLPPGPVALSDQDDVWMPHKLSRAMTALRGAGPVALYGGQSLHTDAALRVIGRSRLPRRPPSFGNALTQNIVSGHSAVLNAGALALVRAAGKPAVPYQDWWLYQLVSGAGGQVVIDHMPVLYYRQHGANAMGAHQGLRASRTRLAMLMSRGYAHWFAANLEALAQAQDLLTPHNRAVLLALRPPATRHPSPCSGPALQRTLNFLRHRLHRQTALSTAALYLAAMMGRV